MRLEIKVGGSNEKTTSKSSQAQPHNFETGKSRYSSKGGTTGQRLITKALEECSQLGHSRSITSSRCDGFWFDNKCRTRKEVAFRRKEET